MLNLKLINHSEVEINLLYWLMSNIQVEKQLYSFNISLPSRMQDQIKQPSSKTRDFICSCGKNYLSYAALFTHIKQKHGGSAPGPIVRPRSQRKRGRPRKNPMGIDYGKQEGTFVQNSESDQQYNGIQSNQNINNIEDIIKNNYDTQKTKKAAELLECGNFRAFQAYKPQSQSALSLKDCKSSFKKLQLSKQEGKKCKNQKRIIPVGSDSQLPSFLKSKQSIINQNDILRQCENSFGKIFKDNKAITESAYSFMSNLGALNLQSNEKEQFHANNSLHQNHEQTQTVNLSISQGLAVILKQTSKFLSLPAHEEMIIFIKFLKQYLKERKSDGTCFLDEPLEHLVDTNLMCEFIEKYLPYRIEESSDPIKKILQNMSIFQFDKEHPMVALVYISNWISINQHKGSVQKENKKLSLKFMSPVLSQPKSLVLDELKKNDIQIQ